MARSPDELSLEARLAALKAERSRLDASIADAEAGLRALRGEAAGSDAQTDRIVALLRHSSGPLSRAQIAEALGMKVSDRDRLSRLLNYLASDQVKRVRRTSDRKAWELAD